MVPETFRGVSKPAPGRENGVSGGDVGFKEVMEEDAGRKRMGNNGKQSCVNLMKLYLTHCVTTRTIYAEQILYEQVVIIEKLHYSIDKEEIPAQEQESRKHPDTWPP